MITDSIRRAGRDSWVALWHAPIMSTAAAPPPGYLSHTEADELLAPVADLRAFARDMLTHRFVYGLDERVVGDIVVKVFNYAHSMGHGGGLVYGESDWATCIATLPAAELPHFRIVRRTFLNRLRTLLTKKLSGRSRFFRQYLVVCDHPEAVRERLTDSFQAHMLRQSVPVSLEGRGDIIVAQKRGALRGADQVQLATMVGELVALL